MNGLLAGALDAHGNLERWNGYVKVEATIVSGGGFFALKGVPQDSSPRRMTVWLHEERSSVAPYGAPDQRTMFTPDRIAIEKLNGTLVAERYAPRDSFAGHQMSTPWDALHRAYFNGEALWTYLTTRRVKTLMKRMGIEALCRRPRTTKPERGHKIYPYLLRGIGMYVMSIAAGPRLWRPSMNCAVHFRKDECEIWIGSQAIARVQAQTRSPSSHKT
jgi:hypothetical protein